MSTIHGQHGTQTYIAWKNMKARCSNSKRAEYKHYGGRGIVVSPIFATFKGFFSHLGECPAGLTLDRIDNNGNYEPGNVRWATKQTQMRNRSDNVFLTFKGKTQTLSAWAEEIGVTTSALWGRLHCSEWPLEKALTTPPLTAEDITKLRVAARWA